MVFGAFLWVLISFIPLQISPEFVVREIRACCHHRITFKCENSKIAIIQARYFQADEDERETIAAVIDSSVPPSPSSDNDFDHHHHPFIHPSRRSVSLWDLDVKFVHELQTENIQRPFHVNTLPEWHPDHNSHAAIRRRFRYSKVTIPPKYPLGANFSSGKVLEMPLYDMSFLDKDTIWKQPLFPVVETETRESSSLLDETHFPTFQSIQESDNKCLSYQTLMSASVSSSTTSVQDLREKSNAESEKQNWNFKDLRPYFNKRCSGKSECDVYLLRNNESDQDLTQVCQLMPDGRINVKYLCYNHNPSEGEAHSKCNVDIKPADEGFLMNPGYPEWYPGPQPCQWRIHVPQQKILLIFFDISLRAQDKVKCRDELIVTDAHRFKLLSTCGDQGSAIAVLSETHQLNITLKPESRLAFPKRGFLAYYRVIGCVDPETPLNSYMAYRNATHAQMYCDMGHIYPDTLSRSRWLYCSPLDHRWLGAYSVCQDIRNYVGRNATIEQLLRNDPSVWPIKHKTNYEIKFSESVMPIMVMLFIFIIHGVILYLIWRQRSRLEEIENQTNFEMERICAVEDSTRDREASIFSFPDSIGEDLWDHDELELDPEDLDHTLTTLTLQTDTPNSSAARKVTDLTHYEERNGTGRFRFYQNGSATTSTIHSSRNGHGPLNDSSRSHIGYSNGQLLPLTFNGYYRSTAV